MASEEDQKSPQPVKHTPLKDNIFSPRFRSVVAMAGWDEETILMASLIVEDTPDRDQKHNKRPRLASKTPPVMNSKSKSKMQWKSPVSNPVLVFNLDHGHGDQAGNFKEVYGKNKINGEINVKVGKINGKHQAEKSKVSGRNKIEEEIVVKEGKANRKDQAEKFKEVSGRNKIEEEIVVKEEKANRKDQAEKFKEASGKMEIEEEIVEKQGKINRKYEADKFKEGIFRKIELEGEINMKEGMINEGKKVAKALHSQDSVYCSNPTTLPAKKLRLHKITEKMIEGNEKNGIGGVINMKEGKINEGKKVADALHAQENNDCCSNSAALPSMDKLREELSCAVCLDLCFEPSTTSCGHSFCKKCLRSAAEKCGKRCPKCRELISNGRCSNVNTVLWNTIQLLFPEEVKERIEAAKPLKVDLKRSSLKNGFHDNLRSSWISARVIEREDQDAGVARRSSSSHRRRAGVANQDADSALALRLQREEFMEAFRNTASSSTHTVTRANLRAIANRAVRRGGRPF